MEAGVLALPRKTRNAMLVLSAVLFAAASLIAFLPRDTPPIQAPTAKAVVHATPARSIGAAATVPAIGDFPKVAPKPKTSVSLDVSPTDATPAGTGSTGTGSTGTGSGSTGTTGSAASTASRPYGITDACGC